ncbi:MAG: biliverdin-producing heme oxygenase [Terrisporobacter othiniensis]|uniref:biliverdin-producing heme oxygenase n=1 Tax=Terrisporobacter petrolearius TaxID=1460447 RepID=UPI0022E19DBF|nr:biliverdin-producing heme oxygenase [Terrisporobacter petrolearius]MDU4862353.1 biliverdin-producing heme oxygenase [Terrisporobacter othiniensis]MDU6996178.1 biliverdin-producing heme oxygenase [Terrisporobacter othiniensis]
MDLITKIKRNTGALHSAAEHSGILKRIVDGEASIESYVEYLLNLSSMYKVIDETIDNNKDN